MEQVQKIYVEVDAHFDRLGHLYPRAIHWKDGRRFEIDRVLDIRKAASLKAGGAGIRYTCRIGGHPKYLFLEENKWFVEAREPRDEKTERKGEAMAGAREP